MGTDSWQIRLFDPLETSATTDVLEFDDEASARLKFEELSETLRVTGGGADLVPPGSDKYAMRFCCTLPEVKD